MSLAIVFKKIRTKGGRITKIKRSIIQVLAQSGCLVSEADIVSKLKKDKIRPDRSTLYRELLFLTKNHIVSKNIISGVSYFEIPKTHHHHLICLKCNNIEKVNTRNHLTVLEKKIAKANRFEIISHSLEFYGYCRNCQA